MTQSSLIWLPVSLDLRLKGYDAPWSLCLLLLCAALRLILRGDLYQFNQDWSTGLGGTRVWKCGQRMTPCGPCVALNLCSFVVNSTRRYILSLVLRFGLVLLVLLELRSPRFGKRELVCVHLVRLLVLRVLVCFFSLPLGVRDWLRLVIIALPGLFFLPVWRMNDQAFTISSHDPLF